jgi:acetyltransferase-like isoleucine patch superfamily enzyme
LQVFTKNKISWYSTTEIKIGNNCWFGSNVVLLKGGEVGDNCIIDAGCILSHKIESKEEFTQK